jgi:hypothetical protein
MIDQEQTYRVDGARSAWRQVGEEGVVLDLDRSLYFGLNRSAGVLWPLLLAGTDHGELVEALLTAAPEIDEPRAIREVSNFLAAVDAEGLLVTASIDG